MLYDTLYLSLSLYLILFPIQYSDNIEYRESYMVSNFRGFTYPITSQTMWMVIHQTAPDVNEFVQS
jgi:hypothetical protein